jgi:hypothetical protein
MATLRTQNSRSPAKPDTPRKPGLSDVGARFVSMFRDAVLMTSAERGVKVDVIADELGVSVSTLRSWMEPARKVVIPADRLIELVWGESLTERARRMLVVEIGSRAGFVVADRVKAETKPELAAQVCDLGSAFGTVAGAVRDAIADGNVDGWERERIERVLGELERAVAEMRLAVQSCNAEVTRRAQG